MSLRSTRDLLTRRAPVAGVTVGWAAVVLSSETGLTNVGSREPGSVIRWVGTLVTAGATVTAVAAVTLFVLARGIALGLDGASGAGAADDGRVL